MENCTISQLIGELAAGRVPVASACKILAAPGRGRSEQRRTFTALALRAGLPIGTIQAALGHQGGR